MKFIFSLLGNVLVHSLVLYLWAIVRPGSENWAGTMSLTGLTLFVNLVVGPFFAGVVSAFFVKIKSLKGGLVLVSGAILGPMLRQYIEGIYVPFFAFDDVAISIFCLSVDVAIGYIGALQANSLCQVIRKRSMK